MEFHLDILPSQQRRLWPELAELPSHFTLYGGTAVALRLGHRNSVDFDFFSRRPLEDLMGLVVLNGAQITQRAPNTLTCIVDRGGPVKLSFFGVPTLPILQPPARASDNCLHVASLLDLAGTKALVVQMRAEAKDYLDLDAMITRGGIDLSYALAAALRLYGAQFNPQITLKALTYFEDPDLSDLPVELKSRLIHAVKNVNLSRLPQLGPAHYDPAA